MHGFANMYSTVNACLPINGSRLILLNKLSLKGGAIGHGYMVSGLPYPIEAPQAS